MSFISPPCGAVGPPFMATLNLLGLTIGLPIWLFSNPLIPNAPFVSYPGPFPHEFKPHVNRLLLPRMLNRLPFLPLHLLKTLILVNGWVRRRPKGRLRRITLRIRSSLQPLNFMLESHQPLVIMLGVLMYLFLAPIKLISLVDFARVITLSRTVLVFPLC